MREIRQSGSEGGGAGTTGPPYPYFKFRPFGAEKPIYLPTSRTHTPSGP